ncbi:hypothetical protein [Kitasatospora sp. KL5]|uniref:hypothetical protein n=1 Tax=Kitasatospora sp. KL5 TaxID=3425125 RepID=UPI003D6DED6A
MTDTVDGFQAVIDNSVPGQADLVIEPGTATRRAALHEAVSSVAVVPFAFAFGLLAAVPVAVVMLFAGTGWRPVWPTALAIGSSAAVLAWAASAVRAFTCVRRVRFAPVPGPTSVTIVKGSGRAVPQPISRVRRVRIDHTVEEPYPGDARPPDVTASLAVVMTNGVTFTCSLPSEADTGQLHRTLTEALAPTVPVDLYARRSTRAEPPAAPEDHSRTSWWGALGHGGSTGGGGGC